MNPQPSCLLELSVYDLKEIRRLHETNPQLVERCRRDAVVSQFTSPADMRRLAVALRVPGYKSTMRQYDLYKLLSSHGIQHQAAAGPARWQTGHKAEKKKPVKKSKKTKASKK
jgi:hypothetical protein